MVLTYIIMLKVMPKILSILTEDSNEEMTTFIALGICAIFSYLSYYLGLSPATGAFIAGSMVASLPQVKIIEHAIKPYTLTFSALFFIAIGSMVDFSAIFDHFGLILVLCLAILISPFIAVGTVSYLFANFKRQQVIFSSMAMMCVGEFSLLIAKMAGGLNLGIDLVSIGAFIIFITAIIMSLSINYYEKVTDILVTTPISYNHKPRSFSNFMRYLTEEIDTDNTHSNTFKKLLVQTLINILFVSFVIIVWSEILGLIDPLPIARLAVHLVFSLIILIQLGMIYYKSRKMYKTLITIITNIYMTGNDKNSKVVLNNLMLALVLLLLTIFSPVFIVLFKLPAGINFISLFLLILVLLRFKRLFNIVHHTSYKGHLFPRYKKVSDLKFDFHRA